MKLITGLTLAAMLSTSAMAQAPALPAPPDTNTTTATPAGPATPPAQTPAPLPPAEMPAASTNTTPAKATAKKKSAKKKVAKKAPSTNDAGIKPAIPLVVNEPAVARQNNVNVRGQAKINSEIVTRLKQGETVMVIEEVTLPHPKADEPTKWAKIAMPTNVHVFINSQFIDENKAVKPAKLNVRTGPGENFSVVGMLHKGDSVKDLGAKGEWTEIEPPTGAYAFVAAHLLSHKEKEAETPLAPPPVSTVPATTNVEVAAAPPVAPATEPPPVTNPTNTPTTTAPPTVTPTPAVPEPLPPPVEEPPQPRIVQREGIVRGTVSIQAPSYFALENIDTGRVTEYLYTTSTNLELKHWKGKTVVVTGEEGLDERWPNTPVITIQKIQLVQ